MSATIPFLALVDEDFCAVANIYSYLDESGKADDHRTVTFAGFVTPARNMAAFHDEWNALLRRYGTNELHAARTLRYSEYCGTMSRNDPDARANELFPFVHTIVGHLEFAILSAVDTERFRTFLNCHPSLHGDPHYFAFYTTIMQILRHFEIPKRFTVGLICDDDQQKALLCYTLLKKMKTEIPEIKKRVVSICFGDSSSYPAIQAADLFACISRLEAQKRLFGRDYEWNMLFKEFESVRPQGQHLHFIQGFYQQEDFVRILAEWQEAQSNLMNERDK